MKTYSKTEYIERYLDGQLKDGELWEFKIELEKNPEFARQVKLQQEINETLSDTNKLKLRKQLHSSYNKTQRLQVVYQWKYQIAAAITILILIGGGLSSNLFNNGSKQIDNYTIYTNNFNPDNSLFTVRSGNNDLNAELKVAVEAFNNEDYLRAIKILDGHKNNMAAKLYTGFSFMKLSDFDNAISNFNEVIENDNNLFIDQAEYNLALCYLAKDNSTEAKQILNNIINKQSVYSNKAKDIINNIE
ncbi:MAG: hypothetical protein C0598_09255 [Marinilabiliales bacterium]|nr:MAG: hypothetical protein C0598_09255 [Marinilabiliales bacterium]